MNAYGVRANVCPGDSFSLNCHCMVLICLVSALNGRVHPISVRFECAQGRLTVFPGELLTTRGELTLLSDGMESQSIKPDPKFVHGVVVACPFVNVGRGLLLLETYAFSVSRAFLLSIIGVRMVYHKEGISET